MLHGLPWFWSASTWSVCWVFSEDWCRKTGSSSNTVGCLQFPVWDREKINFRTKEKLVCEQPIISGTLGLLCCRKQPYTHICISTFCDSQHFLHWAFTLFSNWNWLMLSTILSMKDPPDSLLLVLAAPLSHCKESLSSWSWTQWQYRNWGMTTRFYSNISITYP